MPTGVLTCAMSMVAISEIHDTKQAFECSRCGHHETRGSEDLRTEDKERGYPGWHRFICTGMQFRHHGKAGVTVFQPVSLLILRRVTCWGEGGLLWRFSVAGFLR